MATTITFTDDVGAATLTNGKPSPGDRFANWVPMKRPVGDVAFRLSDQAMTRFRTGWSYGASLELQGIPIAAVSAVRNVEIADRLIAHLLNGGTCAVNTGDSATSSYPTCGLMPGTTPSLTQSSRGPLEYTLSLAVINLAGSPVQMVCRYV